MSIAIPEIPYNFADLEPVISRDALLFHFMHHQRVCFDRMQPLLNGTELEALPLEELVRITEHDPARRALHRCAAEVWSHTVYWQSLHPRGGGSARGAVGELIRRSFGSFERFMREFREAAKAHFGSGWIWLIVAPGRGADRHDPQRRNATGPGRRRAARARPVGARLLPGLPESPRGLRAIPSSRTS